MARSYRWRLVGRMLRWVLFFAAAAQAAEHVFGMLQDSRVQITDTETQAVYSSCFSGLGLFRCKAKRDADDGYLLSEIEEYNNIDSNYGVAPWCLACCSHSLGTDVDTWNLACDLDDRTKTSSNVFGYEFRFARKRTSSDDVVLRCPLVRSGCAYDANGELVNCLDTSSFLVGYELTLHVQENYESFEGWLEVLSCSVSVQESAEPVDTVSEQIVMVHKPSGRYKYEPFAVIVLIYGVAIGLHAALRVLRSGRCDVCDGRLVYSRKTCVFCRFFGTAPLDPKVLAELRLTETKEESPGATQSQRSARQNGKQQQRLEHTMDGQYVQPEDPPTAQQQESSSSHPHAEGSDRRRSHVRRNALAHAYSFKSGDGDTWAPQELVVPSRGGRRIAAVVPV